MPHRIEVKIRVIDEETGRTVRSAMESWDEGDSGQDRMLGMILAPMIDWFTENNSLCAVCEILGNFGRYGDYKQLRRISSAYESWDGGVPFDECITVTVNKDKLPILEGKDES